MILLVTQSKSRHADLVEKNIISLGKIPFRLNVDRFLQDYCCCWNSNTVGHLFYKTTNQVVYINEITSVWWYDFPWPSVKKLNINRQYIDWAKYETRNGLLWILSSLNAWYMNAPSAIDSASVKSFQLKVASKLGLKIPNTIITNEATSVRTFANKYNKIIFKTLAPLSREKGMKSRGILSTIIDKDDVEDGEISVKLNLFQEFIDKKYDLRVTVIDDELYSVKIDSQKSKKTSVDWRWYDIPNTPHYPIKLPPEIEKKCIALTKELNLIYGAIDLVVSKNEAYYFLEINPMGLWLWLEGLTGIEISKRIAKKLIDRSE